MKKITLVIFFLLLVSMVAFVSAHGNDPFDEAVEIIEQKISCDQLSEEQLEGLGDYYTEQMYPGKSHEKMYEIMGGKGSPNLKEMHINMAQSFYCGKHAMLSSDTMNILMGRGMLHPVGYGVRGWNFMMVTSIVIYATFLLLLIIVLYWWLQKRWKKYKKK
jgi:hypothetical protein